MVGNYTVEYEIAPARKGPFTFAQYILAGTTHEREGYQALGCACYGQHNAVSVLYAVPCNEGKDAKKILDGRFGPDQRDRGSASPSNGT
jgi:hypothetical protein